jgi:transcription elongation factor GreB
MSKAFTKEDDGDGTPEELLPPRSSTPQPMTPAGLARLRAEHAALTATLAPGSPLAPTDARRLRALARILETVYPREPSLDAGGAGFGAFVTFEDEDGHVTTYQLVGPDEADLAAGRLSIASPLAHALVGKPPGETVTLHRPKGDVEVTIRDVKLP